MKLYQIIFAIPALNKLGSSDMPLPYAYKLQKLSASLQPDIGFFDERNSKIIQKYDGKIEDNGTIIYPDEKKAAAQIEFDELMTFDVKTKITAIKIPINENIKISANDIAALKPFIEFDEQ